MVQSMMEQSAPLPHRPIEHPLAGIAIQMAIEPFVQASEHRMELLWTQLRLLDMLEYIQEQHV